MNKKGQTEEIIEQIPYIIITIVVMAAMFFLISYYSRSVVDVKPIQREVFINRMLYQPNALSYTDPLTGKVYPGIIMDSNFTSAHLDQAINYTYEKQIMAKFELLRPDNAEVIKVAYYHGEWYKNLEPLARSGVGGAGGASFEERTLPAVYWKGDARSPVLLKISTIIPN
jgi:hypothetical protein